MTLSGFALIVAVEIMYAEILNFDDSNPAPDIIECTDVSTNCV